MKSKFTKCSLLLLVLFFVNTAIQAQCTFTGLNPTYCTNSPTTALVPSISGGSFSGPGVVANTFSPALAGPGTHTITYGICQSSYAVSSISYAPSPTLGTQVSLSDDSESGALPIGFTFNYFCSSYTNFYISSNGFIEFSITGNGCCSGQSLPNFTNPSHLIAWCWTDLLPNGANNITYTTTGVMPNRVLVVSFWENFYSGGGTAIGQIKLYETTNIIEIHNASIPSSNTSSTRTEGISNLGGSIGYPVTGRNASIFNCTNDAYRWTPGTSCSVTNTTVVSPSTISVVGNASICTGATTTLTATGNTTYSWNTSSNSNSIVVSPTITTTYAVAATNSFNCIANSAITVTVDNTPTVTVVSTNPSGGVCPGSTVALSGAGATAYLWTGGISNGVAFPVSSQSTFTVTGTNACGSATAAASVSIHPLPVVTPIASQPTICSGNPVTLTGVGNATNYVWNGNVANATNWFPSVNTTYTVVGYSAQSCTNSAQITVTVVTTPVAPPLANPALICVGATATLSSTGATNYTWTTPTGTLGTSSITVSPVISTTYILTKANSNCVNTQTVGLIVNPLPNVFAIVTPTLICASNQATLQGAGASTYTWMAAGPPVFTTTGTSPVVSPSVTTLYTVTASDGTCVNTTTVLLTADPNPTITINATNSVICRGDNVTLTANGATGYSWTTVGITSNTNAASITETPVNSTLYSVIGQNSFNCTSMTSQVVVVNNTPTLAVSASKPLICANSPVNLTVTANQQPPVTYQWDANAANATTSVTTVSPPVTTIYTVTGTYVSTQCSSSKTIQVSVFLPTFAVNSPTSSCLGGTINLIASGANSYTWNGNQPFSQIAVSPPTATVYQVAATSVSAGVSCISTNSVVVSIYSNPTVSAAPQRTLICKFESTNLVGYGAVSYIWSTGQTGTAVPVNPLANTVYTVEGTDQNGCKGTASVQLKVSTCAGIGDNSYAESIGLAVYPNPSNGLFTVKTGSDADLHLINELGQLIQIIQLRAMNDHQVQVDGLSKGIYYLANPADRTQLGQKIVVSE